MKIIREVGEWLILPVLFVTILSAFVFQPTKVLGSSMEPTLHNEDHIYISKLSHTLNKEPHYGDVVIIDSRVEQKRTLEDDIKRQQSDRLCAA
ncbi:signal peptidase I [Aneurinibacillus tyrosinisolvens]|uniref:signal peptidase I n=1 Tax=Aneurinibacillus tyrosinisolvens TaxID=1443435 RepID=UPI00069AFB30|nr:signal peptidase I [Aneurinibacillus tyrosinisolvens]